MQSLGLSQARGVVVTQVEPNSPAAQAGIQAGDVVTRVNDVAIESISDFARNVGDAKPGTVLQLEVWRDKRSVNLSVTVGKTK